jgi:hypothetical protein
MSYGVSSLSPRQTPSAPQKPMRQVSCSSVISLTLLVAILLTSLGCCSTAPDLRPPLPGARPPESHGVSREDVALVESGRITVIATEDLNRIVKWGARWKSRAETLEKVGRWAE